MRYLKCIILCLLGLFLSTNLLIAQGKIVLSKVEVYESGFKITRDSTLVKNKVGKQQVFLPLNNTGWSLIHDSSWIKTEKDSMLLVTNKLRHNTTGASYTVSLMHFDYADCKPTPNKKRAYSPFIHCYTDELINRGDQKMADSSYIMSFICEPESDLFALAYSFNNSDKILYYGYLAALANSENILVLTGLSAENSNPQVHNQILLAFRKRKVLAD